MKRGPDGLIASLKARAQVSTPISGHILLAGWWSCGLSAIGYLGIVYSWRQVEALTVRKEAWLLGTDDNLPSLLLPPLYPP